MKFLVSKPFLMALCGQLALYGVQFLILPHILRISAFDDARNTLSIVISTLILSIIWMALVSDHFSGWLVGIILYFFAVHAYRPINAYGIGCRMFEIESLTISLLSLIVLMVESLVWITIKIVRKLHR